MRFASIGPVPSSNGETQGGDSVSQEPRADGIFGELMSSYRGGYAFLTTPGLLRGLLKSQVKRPSRAPDE